MASVAVALDAVEGQAQTPGTKKPAHGGFRVAADDDRDKEHRKLFGDHTVPLDFKVSTADSRGGMFIVEHTDAKKGGPPRHLHHDQDEWFYVVKGDYLVEVAGERSARIIHGRVADFVESQVAAAGYGQNSLEFCNAQCAASSRGHENPSERLLPSVKADEQALRRAIERGQPFSAERWIEGMAKRLSLESTLRPRDRPHKSTTVKGSLQA